MQRVTLLAVMLVSAVMLTGCSEKTQQQTDKGLHDTGQAVESAAEDTGNVVGGAVEGASDAAKENKSKPTTDTTE